MSRVTVILPSYNHAGYVAEAIESVRGQTHPDVQLIVIDDGSTDESPERIEAALRAYGPGVRFLRQENQGLVPTLARGLEIADGDYVCELASDDLLLPDSLERRALFLDAHPDHVGVFSDAYWVRGTQRTAERVLDEGRRALFEQDDPIPDMLAGRLPVFATGLFRAEALRACGGFDAETFRYYEDLDTPIRLALAGRLATLAEPLFLRREHDTNVSGVTGHIRREMACAYERLLAHPACQPYAALLRTRLRRAYLALARHVAASDPVDERDLAVLRGGWSVVRFHPRLLWHLVRHGR